MYTELFSRANHQLEDLMLPARKLQGTMVEHMAKITDFQLDTLRGYSELGMKELRALQDVNDPQSLQSFMSQHADLMRTFSDRVSQDMNELVKLQRRFAEDLQTVGRESASKVVQAAESTAEQATRAASQTAERGAEATRETTERASRAAKGASEEAASESGTSKGPKTGGGSESGKESSKRSA